MRSFNYIFSLGSFQTFKDINILTWEKNDYEVKRSVFVSILNKTYIIVNLCPMKSIWKPWKK